MSATLSAIWVNKDGCTEYYRCDTILYLMPMLSNAFYFIIDRGISAPYHVREVSDGLNSIENGFFSKKPQL